ncbi:RNA polymerase sigma-54 factor [candidate division WOR-3 bacterium JGI_Cruoil_03_44_89]|uniref:RNA polymerase sigma-54 factor n=1 Tax=candidate division WOR-3 bacterium JGI_Cruoil_03_44_89 TaxID=1973748 RepID=A0A235BZN3_UNCW3|nr:MAG: RNA polymerase sigma-54 factor [candidate division WOR-3 bacterium JGI_Cruoil_03_44_89]
MVWIVNAGLQILDRDFLTLIFYLQLFMKRSGQIQRQKVKLRQVLTKKLIQSLDILVLPRQLLLEFIESESEDNLFIEFKKRETEMERDKKKEYLTEEIQNWCDISYGSTGMEGMREYTELPDTGETLQEHLLGEISLVFSDELRLKIASEIVYSLDEKGLLRENPGEIADRMGVGKKIVSEVLEKVQGLDPAGIAASDPRECLLIQLKRKGEEDTLPFRILKYAYECFLSSDKAKLASKFAVSEEDVEKALERIYKLDPLPGRHLCGEPQYVYPDAVIEQDRTSVGEKDDYIAYVPDSGMPHLSPSPIYRRLIENPETFGDEERDYLIEKFQRAKNFLKAIEQRKRTIQRITKYIMDKEFRFLSGNEPPVLITERDVAQHIGVDVSTVSRAIKDKWLETPKGMFKFSHFFSHGRMEEYYKILFFIWDMVKKENKNSPLSDRSIADNLREKGYKIARTTIVKYRKNLGIPTASKRRI